MDDTILMAIEKLKEPKKINTTETYVTRERKPNCFKCGSPNVIIGTCGNWWCPDCKNGRRL